MMPNFNFDLEGHAKNGLKCIRCVMHFSIQKTESTVSGTCYECNTSYKVYTTVKDYKGIKLREFDIEK